VAIIKAAGEPEESKTKRGFARLSPIEFQFKTRINVLAISKVRVCEASMRVSAKQANGSLSRFIRARALSFLFPFPRFPLFPPVFSVPAMVIRSADAHRRCIDPSTVPLLTPDRFAATRVIGVLSVDEPRQRLDRRVISKSKPKSQRAVDLSARGRSFSSDRELHHPPRSSRSSINPPPSRFIPIGIDCAEINNTPACIARIDTRVLLIGTRGHLFARRRRTRN